MVKMNKKRVFELLEEIQEMGVYLHYTDAKYELKDKINELRRELR